VKIYGYTQEQIKAGADSPSSMSEITLVSSAEDLRLMASYLNNIADQIDKNSDDFEHEHLSESNEQLSDTEIVVFNEAAL